MATTTTVNSNRNLSKKNFYTDSRTLYWIIGALVIAALIIFFAMDRQPASLMNTVPSTIPATVQ